jgi:hypothetical protein
MHTVTNITAEPVEVGGQTFAPGVETEVDPVLWGFLSVRPDQFKLGPVIYPLPPTE